MDSHTEQAILKFSALPFLRKIQKKSPNEQILWRLFKCAPNLFWVYGNIPIVHRFTPTSSTLSMFSNFNCPSAFVSRVSGPAAQFPNSKRVSLNPRMIFRAGQLAGRGLVVAFVNCGAASAGLSSKTGSEPRDPEYRGPKLRRWWYRVSMAIVQMANNKKDLDLMQLETTSRMHFYNFHSLLTFVSSSGFTCTLDKQETLRKR